MSRFNHPKAMNPFKSWRAETTISVWHNRAGTFVCHLWTKLSVPTQRSNLNVLHLGLIRPRLNRSSPSLHFLTAEISWSYWSYWGCGFEMVLSWEQPRMPPARRRIPQSSAAKQCTVRRWKGCPVCSSTAMSTTSGAAIPPWGHCGDSMEIEEIIR